MKTLFLKLFFILILSLLISFALDQGYRRHYQMSYDLPKNVLPHPQIQEKYEIVKVGNSHASDGITFAGYRIKPLSLDGVAQPFVYDLANLKMYARQINAGAVILINVSPISFSQERGGIHQGFQYQYYDGRLSPWLIPRLQVDDYLQSQIMPFVRTGYAWREKVKFDVREQLQVEREAADIKPTPTPQPTPVIPITPNPTPIPLNATLIEKTLQVPTSPSARLQESVGFMVNKWLHTDGFGKQYFADNRKDLEKLIKYCLDQGWQPVLVSIPISQPLQDVLGEAYMKEYVSDNLLKTKTFGVPYYDYSHDLRLTRNDLLYNNSDHLNDFGGEVFSYLVLRRLIQDKFLAPSSDGYVYPL